MEKPTRTFIAIKIIPDSRFLQLHSTIIDSLTKETIKWVEKNNFHLTLRFLGDTTLKEIEELKLKLEDIADKFNPFHFNLKGIGYFASKGKPRVLFAKIEESQTLKLLANEVNKKIVELGFEKATREFKPHLTLGRIKFIKDRNNFHSIVQQFENTEIQLVKVSEIIFYKSILSLSDPVYRPLKIIKLNNV